VEVERRQRDVGQKSLLARATRVACHAKSRPDFAAKITVVAEEASETAMWFRLFVEVELITASDAKALIQEGLELTSIAIASARTARRPRGEK